LKPYDPNRNAYDWEQFSSFLFNTTSDAEDLARGANGAFSIPQTGETSANTWSNVQLTVTDSSGLQHVTTQDILPRKANLTLATNIPGLALRDMGTKGP